MTIHAPSELNRERLNELLNVNLDARRYFYAKADERWLDWLWQNGFLDPIKEEDPTLNGYRPPELDYLVRMAENCPTKVVDIMLDVPISTDARSQQAAYQFLRICRILPPDQLARVVEKIRSERWVPLLAEEDPSVFAFEEMLKKLAAAEDYRGMVVLTGAVLAVRSKEKLADQHLYVKSPFYFDHLLVTGIFERLAAIDPEYAEDAFALVTEVMADVVRLGALESDREHVQLSDWDSIWQRMRSREADKTVFVVPDRFSLLDVDFFELELGQGQPPSFQGEVRELAAVIKILADRLIGEEGADQTSARRIYERYVATLPDSSLTWRLRLYFWSLWPEVFSMELQKAYSRIFEVERPYEIMKWREFQKSLRKGFPVLSAEDRRIFVRSTIEMYSQRSDSEMDSGSCILSLIHPFLSENPDLVEQARAAGFQLDPEFEPSSTMSEIGELREVIPQAPLTQEEFGQLSITEIARRLRKEWTPEKLNAQNTLDDTYTPLNASGIGNLIKYDMPFRLQEYINSAKQFFDRGLLDPHYTYEYLAGIEKTIRDHRETAEKANWDGVIDLLEEIKESGDRASFARGECEFDNSWHASWDSVHLVATDVLRDLLSEKGGCALIQFGKYREQSLEIINYLLNHPQPSPEDEKDEMPQGALDLRARKRDPENRWLTDPLSSAIQTVRGRAFETFVLFSERDGLHLRDDVKQVYQRMIQKEATRALMSMAGRFLPVFYFRDMDWIRKFLPQIFSQEPEKRYLNTSAWEGYLTNGLYREMFTDSEIQYLYWRGLDITDDDYPRHQRHVTNPDEGIAEHLALALMYYNEEFGFDHPLFKAFWEKDNPKQHAHFVSFLGQEFVFRSNMHDFFKDHPEGKQRLRDSWVWVIKNHNNPETFREFGLWINLKKEIFEPVWLAQRVKETLEKSEGVLNSENDLRESSVRLAHEAPEDTLKIAQLHLLEGGVRGGKKKTVMRWDLEEMWVEAFKNLYRNPATKGQTETLINLLVLEGGQRFWPLGEIVKDN